MSARGVSRLVSICLLLAAGALAQAPSQVTTALTIRGSVEREITLSLDDLKALPVRRVEDARSVRDTADAAPSTESTRHYVGCLLRDVLDSARPVERARAAFRRSVVIATASDGYRVTFSWAELYISPIGDGVLVIYERDGKPLADDEERIALVSLKDARPGPRHVKWLKSIELRTLDD